MLKRAGWLISHVRPMQMGPAVFLLAIGWLILCAPWFVEKRTIPFDSKDYFYPSLYFVSQSIRNGALPFWNPYVYGGYPMVSDPQANIFSPVALLLMIIVDKPSVYWFDGVELLHVLIGGLGMVLLSVRFGRSATAGLFSAAVYMFGGSAAGRMQHVSTIFAYSYFPFALLTLEHALDSNRVRWAACFGLVAGIMAAHQNQVAYLFSLVLFGYVLYRATVSESPWVFFVTRRRVLATAALVWTLTVAVPLYLTLQFLPLSNRSQISFQTAVQDSIHPLTLLTLFVRNFFDNAHPSSYWGLGDITETYLYAGILPIVLIARYGVISGALFKREFRYFSAVGFAAALYALGGSTYFYWLAYHLVPGVSLYRRPTDATFVINMVLALATGFLMDRLLSGSPGGVKPGLLLVGTAAIVTLFAWGIGYAWRGEKLGHMMKDLSLAVVFVAVALVLLHAISAARLNQTRLALAFVGLVLLTADLSVHNTGSALNAGDPGWFPLLAKESARRDPVAGFLKNGLDSKDGNIPYRADITQAGSLWANIPMIFGIHSTQGYNPLRYALYERSAGAQESFNFVRPFPPLMASYNAPLLNLLGVKYIASTKSLREIDHRVDEKRFPLVLDEEGIKVWQNLEVLPRILTATAIYVEPDLDRAISEGKMAPVDYQSNVVLQHLPDTLSDRHQGYGYSVPLTGQGKATARVLTYRNTEVVVAIQSERDVIVVLNDPYYPYWRVYVDDEERELLQANYLFRGVHVKAGERRVVFRFEPFSWPAVRGTVARLVSGLRRVSP